MAQSAQDQARELEGGGAPSAADNAPEYDDNMVVTMNYERFRWWLHTFAKLDEEAGLLREKRKQIRAHAHAEGVMLVQLDALRRMKDWEPDEIRDYFTIQRQYADWMGYPSVQGELKLTDEERLVADWVRRGRSANRLGQPARPPAECPPDMDQHFMAGWHQENDVDWETEGAKPLVEPPAPKGAKGKKPKAAAPDKPKSEDKPLNGANGQQLAEALVAANAENTFDQPSWSGFSPDPEDWLVSQKRAFARWAEGVPAGAEPLIAHEGVKTAWETFKVERGVKSAMGVDKGAAAAPRLSPGDQGHPRGRGRSRGAPTTH